MARKAGGSFFRFQPVDSLDHVVRQARDPEEPREERDPEADDTINAKGPVVTKGIALTTKKEATVTQPHQHTYDGTSGFSRLSRMNTILLAAIWNDVTR
jgi:hypothetical protein